MDLAQGALGPSGKYDVQFANKSLTVTMQYEVQGMTGSLNIALDASFVIDKLAADLGLTGNPAIALIKAAL